MTAVRRRLLLLSVLGALALGVAGAGATPVTFSDPAGDAGNAPDLTSLVVDNDSGGTITMTLSIANAADLNEDSYILLFFDADRSRATGDASDGGTDYVLRMRGSDYTYQWLAWTGSTYQPTAFSAITVTQVAVQTFEIKINRSELGNTTGFNLYMLGLQYGGDVVVARDDAPNTGVWTYTLAGFAPTPTPTPTPSPKPAPKPPATIGLGAVSVKTVGGVRAGRIFTVSARVTTDASRVTVRCVIKVSGRAVPVLGRYAAHVATCQGIAPPVTAGKRMAGTMTVAISGDHDARAFSFVIHR